MLHVHIFIPLSNNTEEVKKNTCHVSYTDEAWSMPLCGIIEKDQINFVCKIAV